MTRKVQIQIRLRFSSSSPVALAGGGVLLGDDGGAAEAVPGPVQADVLVPDDALPDVEAGLDLALVVEHLPPGRLLALVVELDLDRVILHPLRVRHAEVCLPGVSVVRVVVHHHLHRDHLTQ